MILTINHKRIRVSVANDSLSRARGLSKAKMLPFDSGMLFVFDESQLLNFWMKDTIIPLDVAFINELCAITKISYMQPLLGKASSAPHKAKYALEMNAGWFRDNDVQVGDNVLFLDSRAIIERAIENFKNFRSRN